MFHGLRANSAPVSGSTSVMMPDAGALRENPRTHSTYAVIDRRRDLPDRFSIVRREIFTGSFTGTNWSRLRKMPWDVCSKRL